MTSTENHHLLEEEATLRLTVSEVLDYMDEPLLFTAIDSRKQSYIGVLLDKAEYLIFFVKDRILREFLDNQRDLRSLYTGTGAGEWFLWKSKPDDTAIFARPVKREEINGELLPRPGYYLCLSEFQAGDDAEELRLATLAAGGVV